ncbi:TPA: hypothetical protein ACH3X3_010968 [Trebouxia sp. C0006]
MVVTPSSYTSNGSALMPLTIHVQDQAATSVSSEGVRISLSAANAMVQGQTEASTNATGFAHADSFIFGAVPETYPLELSLPDYYPQGGKSWSLKLASGCQVHFLIPWWHAHMEQHVLAPTMP